MSVPDDAFNEFCNDLQQELLAGSDEFEDGEFRVDQFTRIFADYLIDAGEIDDIEVCYYKAKGMQLNGYCVSSEEDCIDLFVTILNQRMPPVTVTKAQCEAAFRQAEGCLRKGLAGFHTTLEESSRTYDAFQRIHSLKNSLDRCRIFLLTDGVVNQETFTAEGGSIPISLHVWDVGRVYRLATSGKKYEPIEIDFRREFDCSIPCLNLADPASDYRGYLAVIPGTVLAGIYERYGPRLLERNVRSFLQARGGVNKGIRKTILEEPHRFFAYNNGISATADDIEFDNAQTGISITKIKNLQIVNGGQTTASLFFTSKKDKAGLGGIYVQAKISVIPEGQVENIVPLISRYANSQNKVSDADFYANDPFHVNIESLSRTVWAPSGDETNRQTKWFYERARGQYLDAKTREGTPARKRQFEALSPPRQKFTKTDLAKYENTWMQLPHIVSLGAQKNFNEFAIRLKERGRVDVDVRYFEHLIAKAILFISADKIVRDLNFGGYKANVVAYTIAWLSNRTSQRINLDQIWKRQEISATLGDCIRRAATDAHRIISNPPNGKNVTEWCKRKECWEAVKALHIDLGTDLESELIDTSRKQEAQTGNRSIAGPNQDEQQWLDTVVSIPSATWFEIARWAKETGNLQPWQRSLAFSIGRINGRSATISVKQAKHGAAILDEAKSLGFRMPVIPAAT